MKVLVACEYSGIVRDAFLERGHDAFSCDILPTESNPARHYQCDAREAVNYRDWDLLIAHPPCTRLANSGVRWLSKPPKGRTLADMWSELEQGAALFSALLHARCKRVAVENPVMHYHAKARIHGYVNFTQSIQPWQFGHPESKRICLWLRGLKPLQPTKVVDGREQRIHRMSPGPDRGKERSRFYTGIAVAMADQWGEQE